MMEKSLVIFGAGGFGREVLQLVRDINKIERTWVCEGFLVDSAFAGASTVQGLPVLGDMSWLSGNPDVDVVIAVGSPAARRRIANDIRGMCGYRFATLIHPRAWTGENVEIGAGSIICAGALITTNILIGQHVQVNLGVTIGHDAILEDFVTVSPGVNISGNVRLGEGAEIFAGSVILPQRAVGEWAIIGAGSVVVKSIPENTTAVGAPARVIKERTPGWYDTLGS